MKTRDLWFRGSSELYFQIDIRYIEHVSRSSRCSIIPTMGHQLKVKDVWKSGRTTCSREEFHSSTGSKRKKVRNQCFVVKGWLVPHLSISSAHD